ncbi:MAG: nucleoside hydrolase [Candidatus Hydrogenedentes bacterium]|nr:nucleoside hydrolase [Candidatus Hydrogenedentota bacterium]
MLLAITLGVIQMCVVTASTEVILDTDIGDDIDDTWALMFLISSQRVNLKMIVTACDDTDAKALLVAKMLERIKRTDIPIGKGIKTSDKKINQLKWIEGYSLDKYPGVLYENGIEKMVEIIRSSKDKITLCVIGPMTNIAKALEIAPDIAEKARVVTMAGSVYKGYGGSERRDCEYNVCRDSASARKVFSAPWEITMIPLDTCGTIILRGDKFRQIRESNSPYAQVVIENYNIWTNRAHYPADESSVLFDTLAVYCVWSEDVVGVETVNILIDEEGKTNPDEKGKPIRTALYWKDKEKFENELVHCLTKR